MDDATVFAALKLLAVVALVFANGFFVAAEFSLVAVRRSRVDQLVAEGRVGAKRLQRAVEHLDSHLAATQLGITMSSIALGWLGEPALAALIEPAFSRFAGSWSWLATHTVAIIIAFTIITILHIVIGELMPKSLALQRSEQTALATAGLLRAYLLVFWPVIVALNGFGNYLLRRLGLRPGSGEELLHSTEELKLLASASHGAGMLHKMQHEVVDRVFTLERQRIASYMTPRFEIEWIDLDSDPQSWRDIARSSEHSRLPVGKGSVTELIGIVRARDVSNAETLDAAMITQMANTRPMVVLLESALVLSAFELFRTNRSGIGIVVDEYGDVRGLITLADLLEAFVGELNETEKAKDAVGVPDETDVWTLDGAMPIEEFKRVLGLRKLTADEGTRYLTLAGFIIDLLKKLPQVGARVRWQGYLFEVVTMDHRRIGQIIVRQGETAREPDAAVPRPTATVSTGQHGTRRQRLAQY